MKYRSRLSAGSLSATQSKTISCFHYILKLPYCLEDKIIHTGEMNVKYEEMMCFALHERSFPVEFCVFVCSQCQKNERGVICKILKTEVLEESSYLYSGVV